MEEVAVHIKDIESRGHDYWYPGPKLMSLRKTHIQKEDGTAVSFLSQVELVCQKCGQYDLIQEIEDGTYGTEGEACKIPDEGFSISNIISIPSGKMLVCNSYIPYSKALDKWGEDNSKRISLSYLSGQKEWADLLSQFNLGYVFAEVSPTLFHDTINDRYVLAQHDENYYEDKAGQEKEMPLPAGWERKADITTDLWATVILDLEQWEKDGGEPIDKDFNGGVVEVPAGRYKITQHLQQDLSDREPDDQGVTWFADVELIEAY